MVDFFSLTNVQYVITNFRDMLKHQTHATSFEKNRNEFIILMLNSFIKNGKEWDQKTQINIRDESDELFNELKAKGSNKDSLDGVFSTCFKFFLEYYINSPAELPHPYSSIQRFAIHNINDFDDVAKVKIEFALREMPITIIKSILHDEDFKTLRELPSVTKNAEMLKEKWDGELNTRLQKTEDLKNTLKEYEKAFNFVGLYKGFSDLGDSKIRQASSGKALLITLAIMVPMPIIIETAYFIVKNSTFSSAWDLFKVLPAASMTLLLIYFFRIALGNYNSIKSQLLQIDLRKTLCQFIQSYVDYSKEIKSKDHNPLDKFEGVIFSNIMAAEDKIPSTFDGIDQLANVVNALKGTKS